MPSVPGEADDVREMPWRILVTGFAVQPSEPDDISPSWLAVKPLHNVVIPPDESDPERMRPIHITALQIPPTYEAILDCIPGLHLRPPILPEWADQSFLRPPDQGYDFLFHIGVVGRGPLRIERQGHKTGYQMKDASGALAAVSTSALSLALGGDDIELDGLPSNLVGHDRPIRGFAHGYDKFHEEISTDLEVDSLLHHLKDLGIEHVYTSMDAGHYLGDFIYYCSLAEAQRGAKRFVKRGKAQVLCMHLPPVGMPIFPSEATDAITRIIVWVCRELQIVDNPVHIPLKSI